MSDPFASDLGASGLAGSLATCRLQVFDRIAPAEPAWRSLLGEQALASAYQQPSWMAAWQDNVGAASGITPFIVLGSDASGKPLFLWPLGRRRRGPLATAHFLGGKHANLNLMVWRRDAAAAMTASTLAALLARMQDLRPRVDLLVLQNQPQSWDGVTNPLALLAHQPSPSPAFRGALEPDFEALLKARIGNETRRKLRQKERALGRRGALSFARAESEAHQRQVLDAFFVQKAARMEELGLDSVFDEAGVRAFIEAAAVGTNAPIELYAAWLDDAVIATFGGTASARRLSGMFNSMVQGSIAGDSPGEILLSHVVQMACERGLATFDLGVGDAGYKRGFCNEEEPLIDSLIGVTPLGRAAAPLWRFELAAKGTIKRSKAWQAFTAQRRRRSKAAHAKG